MEPILQTIEAFLVEFDISASAFGAKAFNDPPFVANLRAGRDPKWSTIEKCIEFMAAERKAREADAQEAASA